MLKLTALLALLLFPASSPGQSTAVTWRSESINDLRSNEKFPFSCEFKIYDDRIEWVQSASSESFPRTSTDGILPASGPGVITYNVDREGIPGKITVERTEAGDVILTLDLREGTEL